MVRNVICNWRYYILLIVCSACLLCVFSTVTNESFIYLIVSVFIKAFGFVCGYLYVRLVTYWHERNEIPELSKIINDIQC